jgi:hypothetical protein
MEFTEAEGEGKGKREGEGFVKLLEVEEVWEEWTGRR